MSTKALIIKSTTAQKSDSTGKWHKFNDDIKPYLLGIETGNILDNINSEVLNSLISGVPTPWARAKLFVYAFDYLKNPDGNIQTAGLIEFYRLLVGEWKGLIALVALYQDRISFSEPIYMDGDGKELYDISTGFGKLLFEEKDIWMNQFNRKDNPDEKPFIQLIYYKNQLVGATSPFSIFFTGVDYSGLEQCYDIKWYRNGKFEDPTTYLLSDNDKIQKLFRFISNILGNIGDYETNLNLFRNGKQLVDVGGLKFILREWLKELNKSGQLDVRGTNPKYRSLSFPFSELLKSEQKVFQKKDLSLTFKRPAESEIVGEIKDLQFLLKPGNLIMGWFENEDKKNPLSGAAVYYLRVADVRDTDNQVKYFSLPLSIIGINLFKNDFYSMLNGVSDRVKMVGHITEQGTLNVELSVKIDESFQKINQEYEIEWSANSQKVVMWPNFIADNWDAYYLYSEYPSNIPGTKFIPFFKECMTRRDGLVVGGHNYLTDEDGVLLYSNSNVKDLSDVGISVKRLVEYPIGQVSNEMPRYEVLQANKPIAGLEIRTGSENSDAGYLIVKNPNDPSMGDSKIQDLTTVSLVNDAVVGIDFGSNNTCVHYSIKNMGNEIKPIPFTNRRLALVGLESSFDKIADKDELLFFSSREATNGQIKSWLHEHDGRYVMRNASDELAGGVPVNAKNILVKGMDRNVITTQAGALNYNMKWLSSSEEVSKKASFLRSVWVQVCADLFTIHCTPSQINWSYPGSMQEHDIQKYESIYLHNLKTTPIKPSIDRKNVVLHEPLKKTEAESVCSYALGQQFGLTNSNIFLGVDIGGSTSDILILAKDVSNNNEPTLLKQSSVRLAAGVFFDAIVNSALFRQTLYYYHEKNTHKLRVENIREILTDGSKAPFYLNSVFDQLKEEDDFTSFYLEISREAPFVFTIPAYVTGLLMYYSGKLLANTISPQDLKGINEIHLLPFGKGGRLFHWLQVFPGKASINKYFENCFKKGFGSGAEKLSLRYRSDIAKDNKSEVSIGLCSFEQVINKSLENKLEIVGEVGVKYLNNGQYVEFNPNQDIASNYFENVQQFIFPERFENFEKFLRVFLEFISKTAIYRDTLHLEEGATELHNYLGAFIKNDPEFKKALQEKSQSREFQYTQPLIILEGLCYLEKVLIPKVFKA